MTGWLTVSASTFIRGSSKDGNCRKPVPVRISSARTTARKFEDGFPTTDLYNNILCPDECLSRQESGISRDPPATSFCSHTCLTYSSRSSDPGAFFFSPNRKMVCSTLPGKRLLPQLVDDVARSNPDRIVYSVALSADISRGFRDITARGFADAVNKTSWWLHKTLGKSDKFATIAYIGPRKSIHVGVWPPLCVTM